MLNNLRFFIIFLSITTHLSATADKEALWRNYKESFIQKDGRVIDYKNSDITHTEGIGYTLYFAQYFNDKKTFSLIYTWYKNNIKKNSAHLPGWKWGKSTDGEWKMLDMNSASDANLWIAYALFLMDKKEENDSYKKEAYTLLENIKKYQIKNIASQTYLLPAENGFINKDILVLNPSYMLFEIFQNIQYFDKDALWKKLIKSSCYLLKKARFSKLALNPDWIQINLKKNSFALDKKKTLFSYDAIRIPLNIMRSSLSKTQKRELLEPYINYVSMMKEFSLGSVDLDLGKISLYDLSYGHLAIYSKIAKEYNLGLKNLDTELTQRMKKEHENYYAYSLYLFTVI